MPSIVNRGSTNARKKPSITAFFPLDKNMGRPSKLDKKVTDKIVSYLRAGSYIETAAAASGITKQTLHSWLRRGADGEEPYAAFCEEVETAQAEGEVRCLALIASAAQKQWQAAAWLLERRYPEKYGRKDRRDEEKNDQPLTVIVNVASDD